MFVNKVQSIEFINFFSKRKAVILANKQHTQSKTIVNTNQLTLISMLLTSLYSQWSLAAPPPVDSGSLMQQQERMAPPAMPAPDDAVAPVEVTPLKTDTTKSQIKVMVSAIEFSGNTKFDNTTLAMLVADQLGKEMTLSDLKRLGDKIAELYRSAGYLAKVYLPEQTLDSGAVKFQILEANFDSMIIDDGEDKIRLREDIAQGFGTWGQEVGKPLNVEAVQRSTNILNDLPGVSAAALLTPGKNKGDTNVIMKLANRPALNVVLQGDNFGNYSTGTAKATIYASLDNRFGHGEQFTLLTSKSQGSDYGRLGFSIPVGYSGLRVGANASALNYEVINGEPVNTDYQGSARYYNVEARYPIIRSNTTNLFVTGSYEKRDFSDEVNKIKYSDRDFDIFGLEFNGNTVDAFGGGGNNSANLNFHFGDFNQNDPGARASDALTKNAIGNYAKVNWSLNRLQRITGKDHLWVSAQGQLASENLDSSEKFSLGGPYGVRAFPVTEALGDEGYIMTAEWRHNFTPELQTIAFYDRGTIKLNHNNWDPTLDNKYNLEGAGIGASWTKAADYSVRFVYSHRLGNNPARDANGNDQDGTDRYDRIWMTFIKYL
jgi:hemolysin activation/secretion protein